MGKKYIFIILAGYFVLCIGIFSHSLGLFSQKSTLVVFFDVGQGSSAYIKTIDGYEILIDTGSSRQVLRQLGKYRSFFDRHIDIIIASHADADHIGAIPDILQRFDIDLYIDNGQQRIGNGPYDAARDLLRDKTNTTVPKPGQRLYIGTETHIDFFFPDPEYVTDMDLNNSSMIFQMHMGDTNILFTGDSPQKIERYVVEKYGEKIQSDILVVGHHGSKTSTDPDFLKTVDPQYGIISAAKDNRYGHPHADVLQRLNQQGIEILKTYEQGNIEFHVRDN